jgi:hypothetical protein
MAQTDEARSSSENYSERAKQQNEGDRAAYMKALHLLARNPNQVLLIDETHAKKITASL